MRPDLVNAIFTVPYRHADGWRVFRLVPVREGEPSPDVMRLIQRLIDDGHVVIVESLADLRKRGVLGDQAAVSVRYRAKPGHPVFLMEKLPVMGETGDAGRG